MKFASPTYLIIGAIITIALIMLRIWLTKRNQRELTRFAAARLIPRLTKGISTPRRRIKATLFILGIALLFIALARPQWGTRREEISMQGIDILIALDTSRSMLASDISPNRLERSKLAIHDFTSTLGAARIGLLPFAGDAFLLCPLTLDRSAFESSLNDLDTHIIPEGGTDIARAIIESEKVFEKGANQKILILITDGEDLEGGALAAAREAEKKGITIHTIGVGTPSGNLILLENGRPLTDASGTAVKSKLDDKTLREIASLTGGMYAPLVGSTAGLEQIRSERLSKVTKSELESQTKEIPIERYQWPLGLGLLLLAIEFCTSAASRNKKPKAQTAITALALLTIIAPIKASESTIDPRTIYNEGTELWQQGKFNEAEQKFHDSLNNADLTLQTRAYYNMGNTRYRLGQKAQQKDAKKTIQLWEKAIMSYDDALKLNPDDPDASFNKKLVEKKLEELKQQKENKEEKKEEKEKKDDKQQDQDQKNQDKKDDKKSDQKKEPSDKKEQQKDDQKKSEENDSKDQKEQEQKEQDQKSDSKDQKDDQGKESEDQKDKEGKEGKEDKEDKDPSKKPSEQESKGDPQKETDQQSTPSNAQSAPVQMTKEEAKRLLESLTNEEGKIRFAIPKRNRQAKGNGQPRKDW